MSFYQYFTFKSTGESLTSISDFTNASIGTQFEKNTGDVFIKNSNGIFDKVSRKIIGQAEMDARYARLAVDNTLSGHILPFVDNTYNVGSVSQRWATMYAVTFNGTATSAQYADLAEKYESDKEYPVGTVVEVGGTKEITLFNGGALAGVISANPGLMLNESGNGQYVALKGKVPVLCEGAIFKGQYCIACEGGKVIGIFKEDIDSVDQLDIVGVALDDSTSGTVMVKI